MTGIERVLNALHGDLSDRRAFCLTLSLYGARLSNCPVRDYYTIPRLYLEGQREVVRHLDPDILFSPFVLPFEALAYGGAEVWLDRFPPNVRKPPFRDADRVESLGEGLLLDPGVGYLVEATRILAAEYGADRPVCCVVTAPVDLPAMLLGIETWLEIILFDPERMAALMHLAEDHFQLLTDALFDAGATFVAVPVMFANLRLVTRALLDRAIIPALTRSFGMARGPVVFHHGGNRIEDHLELLQGLPNVAAFVVDPRDSLERSREILGPKPLLMGNMSGPALVRTTPGQAFEQARAILDDRAGDRRFILASGHADVPWDTDLDALLAVRRAVLEAGAVA
jgi:uroporphyrinogen decarboxylase